MALKFCLPFQIFILNEDDIITTFVINAMFGMAIVGTNSEVFGDMMCGRGRTYRP